MSPTEQYCSPRSSTTGWLARGHRNSTLKSTSNYRMVLDARSEMSYERWPARPTLQSALSLRTSSEVDFRCDERWGFKRDFQFPNRLLKSPGTAGSDRGLATTCGRTG